MHEVICSYLQAKQNPNARRKQKKTNENEKNVDTILDEFL